MIWLLKRERKGRIGTRTVLGLALSFAFIGTAPGCRRPEPPVRHSVNVEALLPLHPAWPQVIALDLKINALSLSIEETMPNLLVVASLPPFDPPMPVARTLKVVPQRNQPGMRRRSLEELAEKLQERNQLALARIARRERRVLDAQLARIRSERETLLRNDRGRQIRDLSRKILALEYREVIYTTKIRAYNGKPYQDAVDARTRIRTEIAALTAEQKKLLDQIEPELAREYDMLRRQMEADLAERMRGVRADQIEAEERLVRLIEDRRKMRRVDYNIEAANIPPMRDTPPAENTAFRDSLKLPETPAISPAFLRVREQAQAGLATRRAEWERQRTELITTIREDTLRSVKTFFLAQKWQQVAPGTVGVTDATVETERWLAGQWETEKRP